jgi:hypothetical protein
MFLFVPIYGKQIKERRENIYHFMFLNLAANSNELQKVPFLAKAPGRA